MYKVQSVLAYNYYRNLGSARGGGDLSQFKINTLIEQYGP